MEHTRIPSLPTRLNADTAWEQHRALVMQADADKSLWGDLEHCKAMARSYERWKALFVALDHAA